MPKNKKYTQEQLREAVGIAERYEPGAGAEPKRKTHLQEAGRRLRMRKRRKADRKKYEQITAKKGRAAGQHYSANADKVYRDVKAGKYD